MDKNGLSLASVKLQELRRQHGTMEATYKKLDEEAQAIPDKAERLLYLIGELKKVRFGPQEVYPLLANLGSLEYELEMHTVSEASIDEWLLKLSAEMRQSSLRNSTALLFGRIMEAAGQMQTQAGAAACAPQEVEAQPSAAEEPPEAARANFRVQLHAPEEETAQSYAFVDELFPSELPAMKEILLAVEKFAEKNMLKPIEADEVRAAIRALTNDNTLAPKDRSACLAVASDAMLLNEYASVLTILLANIDEQRRHEPVALRWCRNRSGKWRFFVVEDDLLTCLLQQVIGHRWSIQLRPHLVKLMGVHVDQAWTSKYARSVKSNYGFARRWQISSRENLVSTLPTQLHSAGSMSAYASSVKTQALLSLASEIAVQKVQIEYTPDTFDELTITNAQKEAYSLTPSVAHASLTASTTHPSSTTSTVRPRRVARINPDPENKDENEEEEEEEEEDEEDEDEGYDSDTEKSEAETVGSTKSTPISGTRSIPVESRPFVVLSLDVENYYPSIPHRLIFKILEALGIPSTWREYFRRFLEVSVQEGDAVHVLRRGVPLANSLSRLFSELVLFCMDLYVRRHAIPVHEWQVVGGAWMIRTVDDVYVVGNAGQVRQYYDCIRRFLGQCHLRLNAAKCGACGIAALPPVAPYVHGARSAEEPTVPPELPQNPVRWGLLKLQPRTGHFVVDEDALALAVRDFHASLAKAALVTEVVATYNAFVKFLEARLGPTAAGLGEESFDSVARVYADLHARLLHPAGSPLAQSVVETLRAKLACQHPELASLVARLPEAWFFWPVTAGGLGLRHVCVLLGPLRAAMRRELKTSTVDYAHAPWDQGYKLSHALSRLAQTLQAPKPNFPTELTAQIASFVDRGSEMLGGASSRKNVAKPRKQSSLGPYMMGLIGSYHISILSHFGSFSLFPSEMVPLPLIRLVRGTNSSSHDSSSSLTE